jgi:hypothetical protein
LRTPVLVQGTLAHPAIHIAVKHSQLMLADPGRAKNVDCAALLAESGSVEEQAQRIRAH